MTQFYLGCSSLAPLLTFKTDGNNAEVTITKSSGQCDSIKEGEEKILRVKNIGMSLIAIVSTDTDYLLWSGVTGKRNMVKVSYTPESGQDLETLEPADVQYINEITKLMVCKITLTICP